MVCAYLDAQSVVSGFLRRGLWRGTVLLWGCGDIAFARGHCVYGVDIRTTIEGGCDVGVDVVGGAWALGQFFVNRVEQLLASRVTREGASKGRR
jgi:hypothetical protein